MLYKMLKVAGHLFWAVAAACTLTALMLFLRPARQDPDIAGADLVVPENVTAVPQGVGELSLEKSSVYLAAVKSNDLFRMDTQAAGLVASAESRWRLIGIMKAGDPEAVIEDVQTKETVFLRIGSLFNGMTVLDIKQNKIIFEEGGRPVEMDFND